MNERDRKIDELLELVGLYDKADLRTETYSKGMLQRVQIARGLINDAEILFMDEPTVGLDPLAAQTLRNIIKMLKEQGKTILLTTHNMYEVDELCDRVAIINNGKILTLDTPKNIKARMEQNEDVQKHLEQVRIKEAEKLSRITLEEAYIQLVRSGDKQEVTHEKQ